MKIRPKMFSPGVGRFLPNAPYLGKAGFSLIEMIGVMAIMAILATILVPNALKSIERTAIKAEEETIKNLGQQVILYLRDFGAPPTSAFAVAPPAANNWTTQVGTYSSINSSDIRFNKRQEERRYVVENVAVGVPQRALLISSMRTGQTLPTAAVIRTNFSAIWDWGPNSTTPPTVPPGFAAGWINYLDHLVIERVNFSQTYRTELASHTITLLNQSTGTDVSYRVLNANGSLKFGPVNLPRKPAIGLSSVNVALTNKERLDLFAQTGGGTIDYSYTGASGNRTFEFTDTFKWRAP